MNWLDSPAHARWLDAQANALLRFGRRTAHPRGGAVWLDDDGRPTPGPIHTWITARTVHVYSLGHLMGVPGSLPIAQTAMAGLTGALADAEHSGWFGSVEYRATCGVEIQDGAKGCYATSFVLLAASSAVRAGIDGAEALLDQAQSVLLQHFWDDDRGLCVDTWNREFTELQPYRGMNANMHAVEAMLAAADVSGDVRWLDRATRIGDFLVRVAGHHQWRIPEHYDENWCPILDFNRDRPDDQFQPFGATIGHGLEWSRLLVELAVSRCRAAGSTVDGERGEFWVDAARGLFDRAVADGWRADGAPGFVYTTDWDGVPVVRDRMHWVLAEALSAAATLYRRTGNPDDARHYETWWDYAAQYLLDDERGSWHHQLDAANQPIGTVWPGKPDLYHAFQATLYPRAPLAPSLATALTGADLGSFGLATP